MWRRLFPGIHEIPYVNVRSQHSLKKFLTRGQESVDDEILCNNFSSWFSTYVLSIAFEGLCWVWFMRLCLNRMLQKPNDFRFINSKIKWKIYCTRKEFPRAKVIIQSARLPLTNANFDEWKHQRQQQQKIFQYACTFHRKSFFNLHMSWRDVRIDSATSLIYSLSRKIYFSAEKCTRKPNEMEKVFLLSTLPTRFRYHTSVKGQKMNGKSDTRVE